MKEKLLCYALLLNNNLMSADKYNENLNDMFLENPNDDLLLELEFISSDLRASIRLILEYFYETKINKKTFGVVLLQELKDVYNTKTINIKDFGKLTYALWKQLPNSLALDDPFHTLSYADDPLSWGDEKQTKKIYEDLFDFYI